MSPGTLPSSNKVEINNDNNNVDSQNDPWASSTFDSTIETDSFGFTDDFEVPVLSHFEESHIQEKNFEQNDIYLQHLEAKLARIEMKNKNAKKISAKEMIDSIVAVKEEQLSFSMNDNDFEEYVEEDSTQPSLSGDLRRRMFPEQFAINNNELLHLIQHDTLQSNINETSKS